MKLLTDCYNLVCWFLELVEKREREESSELEELERSERRPWRITGIITCSYSAKYSIRKEDTDM